MKSNDGRCCWDGDDEDEENLILKETPILVPR
jgi:hypothetical protein